MSTSILRIAITTPRPERDFSLEEKTGSRRAGECEVETSSGSSMCKSRSVVHPCAEERTSIAKGVLTLRGAVLGSEGFEKG
jgi:hypothetical protein